MVYIHYDIALGAHCGLEAAQGHLTLIQQLTQVWTPRWMPPPDRPETETTAMLRDRLGLSTLVDVKMLTESENNNRASLSGQVDPGQKM